MTENSDINQEANVERGYSPLISYVLLCTVIFAVTWLGSLGWLNRGLIVDLFQQSSLARYQVANGTVGPATFYVFHNDFKTLETISQNTDTILGIELTEYKDVAAMAFASLDVDAVSMIREHPAVRNMLQKDIPMICH